MFRTGLSLRNISPMPRCRYETEEGQEPDFAIGLQVYVVIFTLLC